MKNFKKVIALVLALALTMSTFTVAFAASTSATKLNGLGLLSDISEDALSAELTREYGLTMILKSLGYTTEDAKKAEADTPFEDTEGWFKGWAALANKLGITSGVSATKFDPAGKLTEKQFVAFQLRALGYDTQEAWDNTVELAVEAGLAGETAKLDSETYTKADASDVMFAALTADYKTEGFTGTLLDYLVKEEVVTKAAAVEAGLMSAIDEDLKVDSVVAIANNKIAVTLKDSADVSASDFSIIKKGSTTSVAITDMVQKDEKVYDLTTDALTSGTSYTLTFNGRTTNFTGIAADKSSPSIQKVKATDTNTVEIAFTDKMDLATATDLGNYSMSKGLEVVKAVLSSDRKTVTLTTEGMQLSIVYTLTTQNLTNSDGKSISTKKTTNSFSGTIDKTAPTLKSVKVQNNETLVLTFNDVHGMNKESLENVANYSIDGLEIISATAYDEDWNNLLETVVLKTATQKASTTYKLVVEGVTDNSVAKNAIKKANRSFKGHIEDRVAPSVQMAQITSNNGNKVYLTLTEANALNEASVEDVSNYAITNTKGETLEVISAELLDTSYPAIYRVNKEILLTTESQVDRYTYKLEVKGVEDEFGNALKGINGTYRKYSFSGSGLDTVAPYVKKVEYVNSTKLKLTFDGKVDMTTALDPTNYDISGVGAAVKASKDAADQITLVVPALSDNTTYTLTINNVLDTNGNCAVDATKKFLAESTSIDTVAPSITYAIAMNEEEIHLFFDEAIKDYPTGSTYLKISGKDFRYVGMMDDATTLVYVANSPADKLASSTYQVDNGNVFTDYSGNRYTVANGEGYQFYGNTSDNILPEVVDVEQINTKTVNVTFSEPVTGVQAAGMWTPAKVGGNNKNTLQSVWKLTCTSNLVIGREYDLNIEGQDLNGTYGPMYTEKLPSIMDDTVGPAITGVVAIDKSHVEVSYDEDLSTPGTYKITYTDKNGSSRTINNITPSIGTETVGWARNKVELTLGTGFYLDVNYAYDLVPLTPAKDVAGNRAEVSGITQSFPGSSKSYEKGIAGVWTMNGNTIQVVEDGTFTVAHIQVVDLTSNVLIYDDTSGTYPGSGTDIEVNAPLVEGRKYKVYAFDSNGNMATKGFDGRATDYDVTLNAAGVVTFEGSSELSAATSYTVEIIPVDTTSTSVIDGITYSDVAAVIAVNASTVDNKNVFTAASTVTPGGDYYVVVKDTNLTTIAYAAYVTIPTP